MRAQLRGVGLALGALALGVGCGPGSPSEADADSADGYIDRQRGELHSIGSQLIPPSWSSVKALTPHDDVPPSMDAPVSLLVVGTVASVQYGASYTWEVGGLEGGGIDGPRVLPPNDDEAMIDSVIVELQVAEAIPASGEKVTAGDTVRFGLSLPSDSDLNLVETELRSHEQLIAFLYRGAAFPGDPAVFDVLGDGDLLGFVDGGRANLALVPKALYPPTLETTFPIAALSA